MEKDIEFILESFRQFIDKHFTQLEFSYFDKEPREKIKKLGTLKAVYDINETIVLCFGEKEQEYPERAPKYIKKGNITDFEGLDDYKYSGISYRSDLITPHIDVLVNGVDEYNHHITLKTDSKTMVNRSIRRIRYRCDDIQMPNDQPQMTWKQTVERYF